MHSCNPLAGTLCLWQIGARYNPTHQTTYMYAEHVSKTCGMTEERESKTSSPRQSLGRLGERLAAARLEARGYHILERNFRCRRGEIDLVAEEGSDLVFVEVKTRRGTARGLPEEAVDARKTRKLQEVAFSYLALRGQSDCSWRIDVVAVQFSSTGKLEEIRVYQHAIAES